MINRTLIFLDKRSILNLQNKNKTDMFAIIIIKICITSTEEVVPVIFSIIIIIRVQEVVYVEDISEEGAVL